MTDDFAQMLKDSRDEYLRQLDEAIERLESADVERWSFDEHMQNIRQSMAVAFQVEKLDERSPVDDLTYSVWNCGAIHMRASLGRILGIRGDVWEQICHDAFMSEPDDALNERHAQTLIDLLTRR